MNPALLFSLLKRLIGVGLLVLNYLSYGLMIKLAADPSLLAIERIIYPTLIWLIGWVFVIVGFYLAGPELVAKMKGFFVNLKNKIISKNDDK
jgi:hypothetical protein